MPASSAPAGMVSLQLELRPQLASALDETLLKSQQRAEHARDADTMTQFVSRAKAWWGEFVQQNLSFRTRPIKVTAAALSTGRGGVWGKSRPNEPASRPALAPPPAHCSSTTLPPQLLATAEDGSQYPSCCFVKPLQLGRLLASAREAARFVSLLRRREDLGLLPTGGQAEVAECWCNLHTVLASGTATKVEWVAGRRWPGTGAGNERA